MENKPTYGKTAHIKDQLFEIGKLPPQVLDMEESILGAMLTEKESLMGVIGILNEDCFYKNEHRLIFKAINQLYLKNEPVDILTVVERLRGMKMLEEVGGPYVVCCLSNRIASNPEYNARIVLQKYLQREMIRRSSILIKECYDDSVDIFDLRERELREYEKEEQMLYSQKSIKSFAENLKKSLEELEMREKAAKEGRYLGILTGIEELDKNTYGWQNSDLIILAARPGMGKTALALHFMLNAVKQGRAVQYFSLEMSDWQLTNRLIISESEVSAKRFKRGLVDDKDWDGIHKAIGQLEDKRIFVDDNSMAGVNYIRTRARMAKMRGECDMVVVDYLQLMEADKSVRGNREQEISGITRGLKALAKELNVPIIALSQLSRMVEQRGGQKRPQLSDLRESGAIEQDADMVIFIYRPVYHGIMEWDNGESTFGSGVLIIEKHRNGALGDVKFSHNESLTKFKDYTISQETKIDMPF